MLTNNGRERYAVSRDRNPAGGIRQAKSSESKSIGGSEIFGTIHNELHQ